VIESADEFAKLEPAWWDLWERSPSATPFQSPAWLIPWWTHYHPGELFAVAVRDNDRLVGLAPGYIEDGAFGRRILPLGISVSDCHDVLLDPACDGAADALVACVAAHAARWDSWELEELRPDAAALRLPLFRGAEDHIAPQSTCPILPIPAGIPSARCLPAGARNCVTPTIARADA
jgi:CelD/BcsL family acetyltransferase involved in cellulose biosynthesis